jgi:hypothetical protein
VTRKDIIAQAIFGWLKTVSDDGSYPTAPFTWGHNEENLVAGIDGELDSHALAGAIEKALENYESDRMTTRAMAICLQERGVNLADDGQVRVQLHFGGFTADEIERLREAALKLARN